MVLTMDVSTAVSAGEPMSPPPPTDKYADMFDYDSLKEICANGALDFDDWTWLISDIENSFSDDMEKLSLVYDAFLSEFPLCHGYWRKYAYHNIRLCTAEKAVEVFERAVQAATYSVSIWIDYCTFATAAYEAPDDVCRLFERSLSFVGKDYLCCALWDKYIEFLLAQQQWSSLAHVYLQTLRYPSKKLHFYYESFRKLAAHLKEEIEVGRDVSRDLSSVPIVQDVPAHYADDEIANVVSALLGASNGSAVSKALQAYLSIGEQFFQDAQQLMEKISCFETQIRRPFFHVKPLDTNQLDNWHDYLDFAELYGDFDWAVKLYERCLIPCANYPMFWIRYVDFVESKGGREIASFALVRATQTFVKNASVIHLYDAWFKEQIGNASAAYAALSRCPKESGFALVENAIKKANMEKRLGDFEAADKTYRDAFEKISAGIENLETLPLLFVHFSRFKYMLTQSADVATRILMDGIEKVPHCKLLLEELIRFTMMHKGSRRIELLDSIIDKEISYQSSSCDGLSAQDKEYISNLYLELIDLCGTIHDVRKAWKRHSKLFPDSLGLKSYVCPVISEKPHQEFMWRRRETRDLLEKPFISPQEVNSVVQSDRLSSQQNPQSLASGLPNPIGHVARKEQPEYQHDLKQLSLERLSLGYTEDEDERCRDDSLSNQTIKDGFIIKRAIFLTNTTGVRESDALEIQPSGIPAGESLKVQESVMDQNYRDSNSSRTDQHPSVVPRNTMFADQAALQNLQSQSTVIQSNEQQEETQKTDAYNQMMQQYYYYYYSFYQQQQSDQNPPSQHPSPIKQAQEQQHIQFQQQQQWFLQQQQQQQQYLLYLHYQQQQQQQPQPQGEERQVEQKLSMPQMLTRDSEKGEEQEFGGNASHG